MLNKNTVGFGLSAAIVIIFNGLLVIVKETYQPLFNFMASLTGHHWTTHGIFDILLFLILGFLFSKSNLQEKFDGAKLSNYLIFSSVIGVLLIIGFRLVEG